MGGGILCFHLFVFFKKNRTHTQKKKNLAKKKWKNENVGGKHKPEQSLKLGLVHHDTESIFLNPFLIVVFATSRMG